MYRQKDFTRWRNARWSNKELNNIYKDYNRRLFNTIGRQQRINKMWSKPLKYWAGYNVQYGQRTVQRPLSRPPQIQSNPPWRRELTSFQGPTTPQKPSLLKSWQSRPLPYQYTNPDWSTKMYPDQRLRDRSMSTPSQQEQIKESQRYWNRRYSARQIWRQFAPMAPYIPTPDLYEMGQIRHPAFVRDKFWLKRITRIPPWIPDIPKAGDPSPKRIISHGRCIEFDALQKKWIPCAQTERRYKAMGYAQNANQNTPQSVPRWKNSSRRGNGLYQPPQRHRRSRYRKRHYRHYWN